MTAGAVLLLAGAAAAQDGGKVLNQAIPAAQSAGAMKGATPVEKTLKSLPTETFDMRANSAAAGAPVLISGNSGGKAVPAQNVSTAPAEGGIGTQNYGSGNLNTVYHYSDHQIDPTVVTHYPNRTSGYFLHTFNGSSFFYCTATLISKSILVTAGHCVYDTNANKYITAGTFYPACVNCNGGGTLSEPYGHATARFVFASGLWQSAANESAALDQGYDVAFVTLNKKVGSSAEIGVATGWLGWCLTNCLQPFWQLSQLGYPSNYDGGNRMNYGEHIEKSDTRDYQLGSGMRGGSSGGPHVSNIGTLNDSASNKGQFISRNWIFAVTSWGFISEVNKIQGASALSGKANNIGTKAMYNAACTNARAAHGAASCALIP
jgi:V8-like Glu-specific endopeptidase